SSALFLAMSFIFIWPTADADDVLAALIAWFCFSFTAALALRYPPPLALDRALQARMKYALRPIIWLGVSATFLVLSFQFKGSSGILQRAADPSLIVSFIIATAMSVFLFNNKKPFASLLFASVS